VGAKTFTNEPIGRILKEADSGVPPMAELARKHGVSEWTISRWRRRFGGLDVKEATRLKELQQENQ
jgi:putative transposase